MTNIERRLPKIAAFAVPAVVWITAACDTGKPVPKNTPIPPTAEGQVRPAVTNPTIAPAIETIGPKTEGTQQTDNEYLVQSGGREFSLYKNVTIDSLATPQATDKVKVWMNLANFRDYLAALDNIKFMGRQNPQSPRIIGQFEIAAEQINSNCNDATKNLKPRREAMKDLASAAIGIVPDILEQTDVFLSGPCSVAGENQVAAPTPKSNESPSNPTNLEPWTHRFGGEVNTAFKGNYAYAYTLPRIDSPKDAIINLRSFITSPELNSYVADPQKRDAMTKVYDVALDKANANPNDPEIANLVLEASTLLKDVCTTGFHKTIMNGNAAVIKRVSPQLWQQNQFNLLESNCFNAKKYVISPEFKIHPFENGTFVYEDVTHEDVLSYAEKIRQIYPRDSGTIIDWLKYASNNRGTPEEDTGLNSASFILQGGCKDNDVAFNLIRLMASVKGSRDQDSLDLLRLRACYSSFFKDEYFFER